MDSEEPPGPTVASKRMFPATDRMMLPAKRAMPSLLELTPVPPAKPLSVRLPAPLVRVPYERMPKLPLPTEAPPVPSISRAPVPPAETVRPVAMLMPSWPPAELLPPRPRRVMVPLDPAVVDRLAAIAKPVKLPVSWAPVSASRSRSPVALMAALTAMLPP